MAAKTTKPKQRSVVARVEAAVKKAAKAVTPREARPASKVRDAATPTPIGQRSSGIKTRPVRARKPRKPAAKGRG